VINGATNTVTATITVQGSPLGIAVDAATNTVYEANAGPGTLSVINGSTNTVTTTLTLGSETRGVAVDAATDTIYASNEGAGTVSVVNGATNALTTTVNVGGSPLGVAADAGTDTVYVANSLSHNVQVINGTTNVVTASVTTSGNPFGIAADPSTQTVYVTDAPANGDLSVISEGFAPSCSQSVGATSCTIAGTATLTGGTLTVEAPPTLSWSGTLSGASQSLGTQATVSPIDATGSGLGWNISLTSTQFTTGTHTLPTSALTINGSSTSATSTTGPVDTPATASDTAAVPHGDVAYPYPVPAGSTAPSATVFYDANANSGMGTNNLATDWWLAVPSGSYAGTYTDTITVAITSGP